MIGVVDDMRYRTLAESTQPLAYLPLAQRFVSPVFIHARSPLGAESTLQHLRQVVADLDPRVPLSDVTTLSERVDEALDRWRAPAWLAGLLAAVTLVLTMAGLHGVLMMVVGQRTRELAIRVALGARQRTIMGRPGGTVQVGQRALLHDVSDRWTFEDGVVKDGMHIRPAVEVTCPHIEERPRPGEHGDPAGVSLPRRRAVGHRQQFCSASRRTTEKASGVTTPCAASAAPSRLNSSPVKNRSRPRSR